MIYPEGEFWKPLNPWEGCSGEVSEGCLNCWLMEQCKRWGKNGRIIRATVGWQAKLMRRNPTIYAAFNMDFCEPQVTPAWHHAFLAAVQYAPQHQVLVCTKRADRLAECLRTDLTLPNLWVGVTTENQARFDERIPLLCKAWEGKKFVIAEPLLGHVQIGNTPDFDWLLAGRETGRNARPADPAWFASLIQDCTARAVPLWLKSVPDGVEKVRQMPGTLSAVWAAR